jgi:hypothetical protein
MWGWVLGWKCCMSVCGLVLSTEVFVLLRKHLLLHIVFRLNRHHNSSLACPTCSFTASVATDATDATADVAAPAMLAPAV